jgi:dTDP-4-amino-4,6-dideoxygalactose transaminase
MKLNLDLTLDLHAEIAAAMQIVLKQGQYIRGPAYDLFCAEFARYIGVAGCVGLGSGTDALALALRALDIGPGDEVISPAFNVAYTALAIASVGATPVFADVDASTLTLDPNAAKAAVTVRTRAIIPVHIFGHAAETSYAGLDVHIIEDACQAHGAIAPAGKAGSLGRIGAFSFYPTKNLGALGDGGAVVSDDTTLLDTISCLADAGRSSRYAHTRLGDNTRLDDLQAAVLSVRLRHLDALNAERRSRATLYNASLDGVRLPLERQDHTHVYHLYTIRHPLRDSMLNWLNALNIPALIHYPIAAHLQPCFAHLGGKVGQFPVAERAAAQILSLPMHPSLSMSDQLHVIDAVNTFTERNDAYD